MITQNEMETILDLLVPAYGEQAYPLNNPKKMAKISHLWTVMFQDDDPAEVLVAVKDCIATLQFPPKIADIKSRISQNRMAGQPTEMEAWSLVYKAVMESTTIGKAEKAFFSLPKIAQDLIGMPEHLMDWRETGGNVLTSVVESNFLRNYKIKAEREASYHALPADMQQAESWKLPKGVEKPPELPKPEMTFDENGTRVLNIGFTLPEFMIQRVQKWMDDGLTDLEIRKRCMNWNQQDDEETGIISGESWEEATRRLKEKISEKENQ